MGRLMGGKRSPVRLAVESDAMGLMRVRTEADPGHRAPDLAYFEQLLSGAQAPAYVAQAEAQVVGYMVLQRCGHVAVAARRPLQLWQIYVDRAYQGSGIASQLMGAALAHARNGTHDVIWLGVSAHNQRAIAFYRKHGFCALGLHRVGAGNHAHEDLVMSCFVA